MEFAIENGIIGKIMKRGKMFKRRKKKTKIQYQKKSSVFS